MENETPIRGRIENMGVLNLLSVRTIEELEGIVSIENVGCVLLPESLGAAAARIPMENVGSVVTVPTDGKLNVMTGQAVMSGEAIAGGDPDTLLVVAGQLMITSPVPKVGFRGIHVAGQLLAPKGSEVALGTGITSLSGQIAYYPMGARMFIGHDELGAEFFRYLADGTPFAIMGHVAIQDDVSPELLRQKVSEISLYGHLEGPKAALGLAQFLCVEKHGHLSAREG